LFEKDPTLYNVVIRLLAPDKSEPALLKDPTASPEENILGQIRTTKVKFD
jgi:hypothetical protein